MVAAHGRIGRGYVVVRRLGKVALDASAALMTTRSARDIADEQDLPADMVTHAKADQPRGCRT